MESNSDSDIERRKRPLGRNGRRVDVLVSAAKAAAVLALTSVALTAQPSAALVAAPLLPASRRASLPAERRSWPSPSLPGRSAITRRGNNNNNNNPLICWYADEWMDADVELAFHTGGKTKQQQQQQRKQKQQQQSSSSSSASSIIKLKRLLLQTYLTLTRTIHALKETLRTKLIERSTVYVLQCRNGKYYVGSTTNRKRRYAQHLGRKGSKWTKVHEPIKVLREYKRIPDEYLLGMESKVTAQLMLEFGVNNVRGSMFCSPREYHTGDLDSLTKFLGHYNDLNYRKVNARLSQTLPASPGRRKKQNGSNNGYRWRNGRCFNCGKAGHMAASCPAKVGSNLRPVEADVAGVVWSRDEKE